MKKSKKKPHNKLYIIIILILCLLGTIQNWIILRQDQIPLVWDSKDMFQLSKRQADLLKKRELSGFLNVFFNEYSKDFPPMLVFQSMPFLIFMKGDLLLLEDVAVITQSFHLFVLLLSIYFLGNKVYNEELGFFASVGMLLLPSTLSYSRIFLPVLPLTTYFISSITCFLYSDFFKEKIPSILFGLSLGLGMMSKYTFPFYIILFFISYILFNFNKVKKINKKQIKNILIVSSILIFSILIWYPFHIDKIKKEAIIMTNRRLENKFTQPHLLRLKESYNHYSKEIINKFLYSNILYYLMIISLFALSFMYYIKKEKVRWSFILPTFVFLFFISISLSVMTERFIFPIIPIWIIITCMTVLEVSNNTKLFGNKRPYLRIMVVMGIMLLLLGLNYINTYVHKKNSDIIFPDRTIDTFIVPRNYSGIDQRILKDILENSKNISGNKSVLILVDSEPMYLLYSNLDFSYKSLGYSVNPLIFCIAVPLDYWEMQGKECLSEKGVSQVCDYDFVITSPSVTRYPIEAMLEDYKERNKLIKELLSAWNSCKGNYDLINSYWGEQSGKYVEYKLYKRT